VSARIAISVKPGSKRPGIEPHDGGFVLRVRERAVDGAANAGCIDALAAYLGVAPSRITIVRGANARQKLFEIDDMELATAIERLNVAVTSSRPDSGRR
jgi:uncharacterized protein YggU (UPF0235/DUF167 family)